MPSLYHSLALAATLFSSIIHAVPYEAHGLSPRASTCNTASNRACWTNSFNIYTDYEASTPVTGVTRTYSLTINEVDNWQGPDGVIKPKAMLINNQYPGPVITADWGDRINITVTNHPANQRLNSNLHDGANGVTECPIPPGGSKTYSFLATQYGTSWYHSHFSAQYANGVVGTIQINGPASLPYDIDLGPFPISDYYYQSADNLVTFTQNNFPPPSDNVLFNGTNINPTTGAGKYATVTLTPGKRHRLRIINTSAENSFSVSLSGHTMTVIETDFVPVNAMTVDSLFVGIGQRYDVTIDANQAVSNYWFNVTYVPGGPCGSSNNLAPAAIFHYQGAPAGNPRSPGKAVTLSTCQDITYWSPVVQRTVTASSFRPVAGNTLPVTLDLNFAGPPLFTWKVNGSAINIDWDKPVAQYVLDGNTSYPVSENIVSVDTKNQWAFWLIQNDPAIPLPHPIHLHGHDFVLLGVGTGAFTSASQLNGNNPTRRDVAMLPSLGWMVIAFKTDNPGAWLLHCHIAWHVSGGLAVDFLERVGDLKASFSPSDKANFGSNCAAWDAYYPALDPDKKQDSGLRRRQRSELSGWRAVHPHELRSLTDGSTICFCQYQPSAVPILRGVYGNRRLEGLVRHSSLFAP